jgi:hypothetical protein
MVYSNTPISSQERFDLLSIREGPIRVAMHKNHWLTRAFVYVMHRACSDLKKLVLEWILSGI